MNSFKNMANSYIKAAAGDRNVNRIIFAIDGREFVGKHNGDFLT